MWDSKISTWIINFEFFLDPIGRFFCKNLVDVTWPFILKRVFPEGEKNFFFSNKRDIHALLKVSDTSWSEMMRFSFYELWIVTGEETTWSWSCSFVQTSEMKSYWVERWWKRRLNHQLVGYLWPTPAAVSLTLQEPKVCQKNVPPHWKILFKRKFFKNFFVHNNSVRHFLLIPN